MLSQKRLTLADWEADSLYLRSVLSLSSTFLNRTTLLSYRSHVPHSNWFSEKNDEKWQVLWIGPKLGSVQGTSTPRWMPWSLWWTRPSWVERHHWMCQAVLAVPLLLGLPPHGCQNGQIFQYRKEWQIHAAKIIENLLILKLLLMLLVSPFHNIPCGCHSFRSPCGTCAPKLPLCVR